MLNIMEWYSMIKYVTSSSCTAITRPLTGRYMEVQPANMEMLRPSIGPLMLTQQGSREDWVWA